MVIGKVEVFCFCLRVCASIYVVICWLPVYENCIQKKINSYPLLTVHWPVNLCLLAFVSFFCFVFFCVCVWYFFHCIHALFIQWSKFLLRVF